MTHPPSHLRTFGAAATALTVLLLAGCGLPPEEAPKAAPADAAKAAEASKSAAPKGTAGFTLSFEPAAPEHKEVKEMLESSGRFQQVAKEFNESFALPKPIAIKFREGDGPHYDPNTGEISMNYDFAASAYEIFDYEESTDEELENDVLGTVEFVLYHELGHALTDVCQLPVTGKEEDAVDALATYIAVVTEREEIAIAGASLFESWAANREEFTEEDFWDEHSLNEQRTYSIFCWIYGSNPEAYAELARDVEMPESRAERCEGEFAQIANSWSKLLDPHVKK